MGEGHPRFDLLFKFFAVLSEIFRRLLLPSLLLRVLTILSILLVPVLPELSRGTPRHLLALELINSLFLSLCAHDGNFSAVGVVHATMKVSLNVLCRKRLHPALDLHFLFLFLLPTVILFKSLFLDNELLVRPHQVGEWLVMLSDWLLLSQAPVKASHLCAAGLGIQIELVSQFLAFLLQLLVSLPPFLVDLQVNVRFESFVHGCDTFGMLFDYITNSEEVAIGSAPALATFEIGPRIIRQFVELGFKCLTVGEVAAADCR